MIFASSYHNAQAYAVKYHFSARQNDKYQRTTLKNYQQYFVDKKLKKNIAI